MNHRQTYGSSYSIVFSTTPCVCFPQVPVGRPPTYDDYVLSSRRMMSTRPGGFTKDSIMNTASSFDSEALALDKVVNSSGGCTG
jgi:hypothetical protein